MDDSDDEETELDLPDLAKEQREDPQLSTIFGTIEGPIDHENQNHYIIHNNLLYRRTDKNGEVKYALCVPQTRVKDILVAYHDSLMAGHVGRNKPYDTIRRKYYWKNMYKDIQKYVNTCLQCQAFKTSNQKRPGLYQPLPIPNRPFSDIAMDLIGPLKQTKSDNKYILFDRLPND